MARFDHHCFYIDNCVGSQNVLSFGFFLVFFTALLLGHSVGFVWVLFSRGAYQPSQDVLRQLWTVSPVWEAFYLRVMYVFSGTFAFLHLFLAISLL